MAKHAILSSGVTNVEDRFYERRAWTLIYYNLLELSSPYLKLFGYYWLGCGSIIWHYPLISYNYFPLFRSLGLSITTNFKMCP